MKYLVEIDNPLFGDGFQPAVLEDVRLELFRNNQADNDGIINFGLLKAHDRRTGAFCGGLVLQHTFEFLPHGMEARGFVTDADFVMVEPPIRQAWTIFQEQTE